MKKRNLSNLKLQKQTISNLDQTINGGQVNGGSITLTLSSLACIYSYYQCGDVTHTSKDYDGKKCDIATINDSCLSVCNDICNDF